MEVTKEFIEKIIALALGVVVGLILCEIALFVFDLLSVALG